VTNQDIIRMAKEAGWLHEYDSPTGFVAEAAFKFAELVCEACARICEQPIDEIQITDDCSEVRYMDGKECAEAIRARGDHAP
jgi:hypothetical protein